MLYALVSWTNQIKQSCVDCLKRGDKGSSRTVPWFSLECLSLFLLLFGAYTLHVLIENKTGGCLCKLHPDISCTCSCLHFCCSSLDGILGRKMCFCPCYVTPGQGTLLLRKSCTCSSAALWVPLPICKTEVRRGRRGTRGE